MQEYDPTTQALIQTLASSLEIFARAVDKWSTAVDSWSLSASNLSAVTDLQKDQEIMDRTLYGHNGDSTGLVGKVEIINKDIQDIKESQKKMNDNLSWVVKLLVAAILAALVNLVLK